MVFDMHAARVRKLRAVAASSPFPEEAATAKRIADALEAKYGRVPPRTEAPRTETPRTDTPPPTAKRAPRRAPRKRAAPKRAAPKAKEPPKVKPERFIPVDPAAVGRLLRKHGFSKSGPVRKGSVLTTEGYVAWEIHGMGGPKVRHLAIVWRVPDGDRVRATARMAAMLTVVQERWHADLVEIAGTPQILVRAGKGKR